MLPSTWGQLLRQPGKYVLAYDHHFVAAKTDEDGNTYVNFSNRTHMWQRFLIGETTLGKPFEMRHPSGCLIAFPLAFDLVCKISPILSNVSLSCENHQTMDYSGGKTVDMAADDVIHVMQTVAWEADEIRHPQAIRTHTLAEQALTHLVRLTEQEAQSADSDSDDGFWDIRPDWQHMWRMRLHCREAEEYEGGALPAEVLTSLPQYFFSCQYSQALGLVSKAMRAAAQDHEQWRNRVISLNNAEFEVSDRLRAMTHLYRIARAITVNIRQLSMFPVIQENAYLEWTSAGVRPASGAGSAFMGFHSTEPLTGSAAFDLSLPSTAVGIYLGVQELHGARRSYCRIDNLFKNNCTFSFAMSALPAQPHWMRHRPEILPNVPVRFCLRWSERDFAIDMNGVGVSRVRCHGHVADTAPCLSKVFVWIFGRPGAADEETWLRELPSPIQLNARLQCPVCNHTGTLLQPQWSVCSQCSTWICAHHVTQTPTQTCLHCDMLFSDYVGGSSSSCCVAGNAHYNSSASSMPYVDATSLFQAKLRGSTTSPCDKPSQVVLDLLQRHSDFLHRHPSALLFLPDPSQRAVMSKRRWEKILYRGRVLLDFLHQKMDYMLFMYLHASARACSDAMQTLTRLPHPLVCSVQQGRGWQHLALQTALQVHRILSWRELNRSKF